MAANARAARAADPFPMLTRYCPYRPEPKQAVFLALPHKEAFFGGATGGGKSVTLLMAALLFVDVPGYNALLLRETYSQLAKPGALMDMSHEWLSNTDARWNAEEKTWRFPSGASLSFGHMQYESDKYNFQGSQYVFIGFDELGTFTKSKYLYMLSRLRRRTDMPVPVRVRGTGNPGGVGHEWIKERFVKAPRAAGRPFIPSTLDDNPHLDRDAYTAMLDEMDPVTRAQYRYGDWDVAEAGDFFMRQWFVPVGTSYSAAARVRAWDLAATAGAGDWTVGVRMARTQDNRFVVEDVVRFRKQAGERDAMIQAVAAKDGADVPILLEEEGGSAGKAQTASIVGKLAGYVVRGVRPTGPKDVRAMPFASQAQAGNVAYLPGLWVSDWLEELISFPKGVHDDQVDATSLAFSGVSAPKELPYAWLRNDTGLTAAIARVAETDEERIARRMAQAGREYTPSTYRRVDPDYAEPGQIYADLLVATENPDALDATLRQMGAALVGGGVPSGYLRHEGHYVLRAFKDPAYIRFALEQQGYGRVVGEAPGEIYRREDVVEGSLA